MTPQVVFSLQWLLLLHQIQKLFYTHHFFAGSAGDRLTIARSAEDRLMIAGSAGDRLTIAGST